MTGLKNQTLTTTEKGRGGQHRRCYGNRARRYDLHLGLMLQLQRLLLHAGQVQRLLRMACVGWITAINLSSRRARLDTYIFNASPQSNHCQIDTFSEEKNQSQGKSQYSCITCLLLHVNLRLYSG